MTPQIMEELYENGDEWLDGLRHEIHEAKKFIYFESYIFNDDQCGKQVLELLSIAAARGVQVYLLVDGIGSPYWNLKMISDLAAKNIESRIYHPSPFLLTEPWFVHYFHILALLRIFGKLNKRNHRKLVIIDGHTTIIGSINVADCHLKSVYANNAWRDTAVKVITPEVEKLMVVFEKTWKISWHKNKKWLPRLPRPLEFFKSFISYDSIRSRIYHYHHLLDHLKNSKDHVYITNAYFVPRTRLLWALKKCAKRGVDVRIMLPFQSDIRIVKWATVSFYEEMIDSGIRIFEYGPNMLHAKTMIIDDWAIVGSSNLNNRSFLHDLEINVVLNSESSKSNLLEMFKRDLIHCKEVKKKDISIRSWFSKVLSRFAISVKYWL